MAVRSLIFKRGDEQNIANYRSVNLTREGNGNVDRKEGGLYNFGLHTCSKNAQEGTSTI